jgi:hypothetical protein
MRYKIHKSDAIAIFAAAALLLQFCFAQAIAAPKSAAPPAPSSPAPAQDIGWPRQVQNAKGTLDYYQPQVDEWKDYKKLMARIAFSLSPTGGNQVLGVASLQCATMVDKDTRTAYCHDVQASDVRFPSLDEKSEAAMGQLFRELIPKDAEPISVDRLMADLDHDKVPAQTTEVKNDPPQIFYSAGPALLLIVQGDPVLSPIEKTDLQFIVNTNWDLFFYKSKKTYYLLGEHAWFASQDLKGPWKPTLTLPKDFSTLPAGQNFDDVKKMVPPPAPSGAVPQIFFSNMPAELIVYKGAPVYSKVSGTRLLYVANTDNDVFFDDSNKQFYVLLSGRWFRSGSMEGPWTYSGADLPADFAKIPEDSPKGHVLASVPGTLEASDAVMLAQIPTTVVINKAEAEAKAKVVYDGQPQFKPIEKTSLEYATNTEDKVIKVADLYYLCFQGVWFISTKPDGPWKTADSVPKESTPFRLALRCTTSPTWRKQTLLQPPLKAVRPPAISACSSSAPLSARPLSTALGITIRPMCIGDRASIPSIGRGPAPTVWARFTTRGLVVLPRDASHMDPTGRRVRRHGTTRPRKDTVDPQVFKVCTGEELWPVPITHGREAAQPLRRGTTLRHNGAVPWQRETARQFKPDT